METSGHMENAGPRTQALAKQLSQIGSDVGFDSTVMERLGDLLQNAGVQQIETQGIPLPVGNWGGRAGRLLKTDVLMGYQAFRDFVSLKMGITPEQYDTWVQEMANEWEVYHSSYVFA